MILISWSLQARVYFYTKLGPKDKKVISVSNNTMMAYPEEELDKILDSYLQDSLDGWS